jgi:predicted TIM-barrel fold metal-dependent hydrolase
MSSKHLTAEKIRARLKHPVIDADGHWIEFGPYVREEMRRIGGEAAVRGFSFFSELTEKNLRMTPGERLDKRVTQGPWFTQPSRNTRDRATAMLPKLMYERMDELGLDFSVLYPSSGMATVRIPDDSLRAPTCRAFNTFCAEYFAPYADRMTPVAMIPMSTPEEAIAEMDHAVKQLGLKVVCLGSVIPRRVGGGAGGPNPSHPDLRDSSAGGVWYDMLGIDSAHNYDPVWARCVELGLSPTFHSGTRGIGTRASPTNFVYNHIGHFAAACEAVCKAIYIGGVTRRFPTLKFAFLEGGVGYACQLLADINGHWEKRNARALAENDPKNVKRSQLIGLAKKYGDPRIARALEAPEAVYDTVTTPGGAFLTSGNASLDDFAACRIKRKEDVNALFVDNFYFGCEADDPMNAWAFSAKHNPGGARIRAVFGSDVGHFDVQEMAGVLPEAYELVEHKLITDADFRDFMFTNPVTLFGESNPAFFAGTRVEKDAAALLRSRKALKAAKAAKVARAAKATRAAKGAAGARRKPARR